MIFRRRTPATTISALERMLGPTLGAVASFFLEIVQIAVLALVIIVITRHFLILPFIVKGASMEPNFHDNEYLIVDEVTFRLRDPERGEIIVFHPPGNEKQYYIKRVIGLPGEKVNVGGGRVTISNKEFPNGVPLPEEYLTQPTIGQPDELTLGANQYFVMGDNRDHSLDSRVFGAVPRGNIVGRVWIRGLPLDKAGTFMVPQYQY
ncbi:MAG: signal peptidase I [Patescibacteria group bacterium]